MPLTISPDDIDFERARRAYLNISFNSEQRAKQDQQTYVDDVQSLYDALTPQATTERQREILDTEIERYKEGYQHRFYALLDATSRTASPMITSPAKFPVERNRRRMENEDRRRTEFLDWRAKARSAVETAVLDARTPEAKHEAKWQELARDIEFNLATIRSVNSGEEHWNRSAFVTSIVGKVERHAENGYVELVERAIALVCAYNEANDKPAITTRHAFWSLADTARAARGKMQDTAGRDSKIVAEGEGFVIKVNHAADRVQIFFDDKPDEEVRAVLKGAGWHWSRNEGARQRKLTEAAIHSARQLLNVDTIPSPLPALTPAPTPASSPAPTPAPSAETEKSDVYTRVTNKIIADLEKVNLTWMQPWQAGHAAGPVSRPLRANGLPYNGVNMLMLWMSSLEHGYSVPIWRTYKQAQELGGQVRKGQKGITAVYADSFMKTEEDEKGEEVERCVPFLKTYTVFNVEQVDNLPERFYAQVEPMTNEHDRNLAAEAFFRNTSARIEHGGSSAYYCADQDRVQMPPSSGSATAKPITAPWPTKSRTGQSTPAALTVTSGESGSVMRAMLWRNWSPSWGCSYAPTSASPRSRARTPPRIFSRG